MGRRCVIRHEVPHLPPKITTEAGGQGTNPGSKWNCGAWHAWKTCPTTRRLGKPVSVPLDYPVPSAGLTRLREPLSTGSQQRLQAVITRAQRVGFLSPSKPPLSELCRLADDALFSAIVCNQYHVLHGLLPPIKSTGYDLRTRSHDRALLPDNPLSEQNFINRMLTNNYFYAKLR